MELGSGTVINHRPGRDYSQRRRHNASVALPFVFPAPQTPRDVCSVDSVVPVYLYILPLLHFWGWVVVQRRRAVPARISLCGRLKEWLLMDFSPNSIVLLIEIQRLISPETKTRL